jgi:hypothetical protein
MTTNPEFLAWVGEMKSAATSEAFVEALSTERVASLPPEIGADDVSAAVRRCARSNEASRKLWTKGTAEAYAAALATVSQASGAPRVEPPALRYERHISFADTSPELSMEREHLFYSHCSKVRPRFSEAGTAGRIALRAGETVLAKKDPTVRMSRRNTTRKFNLFKADVIARNDDGTYRLVFLVDLSERSRVPRAQIMRLRAEHKGCCLIS